MLWAVEAGASTSGVKLAENVSFCEKEVHMNRFLFLILTGRIFPAGIFPCGQLLYPVQAAYRSLVWSYYFAYEMACLTVNNDHSMSGCHDSY